MTEPLHVCYASQTGTAQEFAERLARQCRRRGFATRVQQLSEASVAQLPTQTFSIFVISTTGDGELPDHAKPWWRFLLRRDLPGDALASIGFAVFGLGDSSYVRFNAAARKVAARLEQLGATPLCERGLGDEQAEPGGLEAGFHAWLEGELWPTLEGNRVHITPWGAGTRRRGVGVSTPAAGTAAEGAAQEPPVEMPLRLRCRYTVEVLPAGEGEGEAVETGSQDKAAGVSAGTCASCESGCSAAAAGESGSAAAAGTATSSAASNCRSCSCRGPGCGAGSASAASRCIPVDTPLRPPAQPLPDACTSALTGDTGPWLASLACNERLTAPGWGQDVRHITLDYSASAGHVPFRAGDVAVIYPRNTGSAAADAAVAFFARYVGLPLTARLRIGTAGRAAGTGCASTDARGIARPATADGDLDEEEGEEPDTAVLPLPQHPITLGQLLSCVLDVQGVPRRSFLEQAATWAADPEQRDKLLELSGFAPDPDGSGSEAYRAYVTSEGRAVWEVLRDFGSVRIPLRHLLELLPPLQPRHYSIASAAGGYLLQQQPGLPSAAARPAAVGRLDLCVGLVEYATPLRRRKVGVASGFLGSLRPGADSVWLQVRRGTFTPPWPAPELRAVLGTAAAPDSVVGGVSAGSGSLRETSAAVAAAAPTAASTESAAVPLPLSTPPLTTAPLILVGPGTGIAPMRALWQERQLLQIQQRGGLAAEGRLSASSSSSTPPAAPPLHGCTLFFGCRNAAQDWLYGREVAVGPLASGALVAYDAAFSRPAVAAASASAVVGLAGAGAALRSAAPATAAAGGSTVVTVASPLASEGDGVTPALAAGPAASGPEAVPHESELAPSAGSTYLLLRHTPPAGWEQACGTPLAGGAAAVAASATPAVGKAPALTLDSVSDGPPTATTAAVVAAPPAPTAGAATAPPPVTYVQARIAAPEHGPAIARAILHQGAMVFISGSAKRMPSDVIAALRGLLQTHGSMSPEEAARYVGTMERGRRLVTEAWS